MSRRALAVLAVALLLVLAGCADGGRPTTTPTATTTSAPTNATGTATNATTSSEPVSLTHTYALPLVVRNGDDRNHTVHVTVTVSDGDETASDDSVTVAPNARKRVYLLTGNGTAYRIAAETATASLTRNVTLTGDGGNATVAIDSSGALGYDGPGR